MRLLPARLAVPVAVLLAVLLAVPTAAAQAVHPDVDLTRPTPRTVNRLDALRQGDEYPITLYLPKGVREEILNNRGQLSREAQAARQWELLLLGVRLPYRVVDEGDLRRRVPRDTRVLILPAVDALERREAESVAEYVREGGGLLAQGLAGAAAHTDFFSDLFGAEAVPVPYQEFGLFQSIGGAAALTAGLPAAYRLNLSTPRPLVAAQPRAPETEALGRLYSYDPDPEQEELYDTSTLALYAEPARGRTLWLRFLPQDVSQEPEQQAVYQGLLLNALATLANVPQVAVRPWPDGHQSATAPVALPLIASNFQYAPSYTRALDALEAADAPGTFFLQTERASLFPHLIERMARVGEVALLANSHVVLRDQPAETQLARLDEALQDLDPYVQLPQPAAGPPPVVTEPEPTFYEEPEPVADVGATPRDEHRLTTGGSIEAARRLQEARDGADGELPPDVDRAPRPERAARELPDDAAVRQQQSAAGRTATGRAAAERRRFAQQMNDGDTPAEAAERLRARLAGELPAGDKPSHGEIDVAGVQGLHPPGGFYDASTVLAMRELGLRYMLVSPPLRSGSPYLLDWYEDADYRGNLAENLGQEGFMPVADRLVAAETEEDIQRLDEQQRRLYALQHLPLEGRIVGLPLTGTPDFELLSSLGEEADDPAAQLDAYQHDFASIHATSGLYVLPFHAEIQALTEERAAVLHDVLVYAREQNSWLATLRDVRAWWLRLQYVEVYLGGFSEEGLQLTVLNGSDAPLAGVSLDVRLPQGINGRPVVRGAQVRVAPVDDRTFTLVLPVLPPGATRLTVTLP